MTDDFQERVDRFRTQFELHMKYEYPQIDSLTRNNLAFELSLLAVGL